MTLSLSRWRFLWILLAATTVAACAGPAQQMRLPAAPTDTWRAAIDRRDKVINHASAVKDREAIERIRRDRDLAPRAFPAGAVDPRNRQRALAVADSTARLMGTLLPPDLCRWHSAGPTNISGRVTGIAIDPGSSQRMFVSTVGGVWRSLDGGRRWTRVSEPMVAGNFGAVAVTPGNTQEVFVGGGDPNRDDLTRIGGPGLWQSVHGGDPGTWVHVGPAELDVEVIYRIRVEPIPPHRVYVATSAGVYRGDRTSASDVPVFERLGGFNAPTSDLAADFSTSPPTLYAGTFYPREGFPLGVWRYTNRWDDVTPSVSDRNAIAKTALSLSGGAPPRLYAELVTLEDGVLGLYSTIDHGTSWKPLTVGPVDDSAPYSWYNCVVEAHPEKSDLVYVGGIRLYRSGDGGTSWKCTDDLDDPAFDHHGTSPLHDDMHAIAFVPDDPSVVIVGNDGGLDRTRLSNPPIGAGTDPMPDQQWHWEDIAHGLTVTEFYRVAVQDASASVVAGGSQDNGVGITYGNLSWYGTPTFDSGWVGLDAANSSRLYYSSLPDFGSGTYVLGALANPVQGTTGFLSSSSMSSSDGTPSEPLAAHPSLGRRALAAGYPDGGLPVLLRTGFPSPSGPAGSITWSAVDTDGGFSTGDQLTALAVGEDADFHHYYVGFVREDHTSGLWSTTDGGNTWSKKSGPDDLRPNAIACDPHDPLSAWVAFGGDAGGAGGVWKTQNGGASWVDDSAGLPPAPVTGIAVDGMANVYASTAVGVYRRYPDQWRNFNQGLPRDLDVSDIRANPETGLLTIGTAGYGAWQCVVRPEARCPEVALNIRDNVFDRGRGPAPHRVPDPEHPVCASVPPTGAPCQYYVPDASDAGSLKWWVSCDIRIDAPDRLSIAHRIAYVDHVEFEGCATQAVDCPPMLLVDTSPLEGEQVRVHVQVQNRGRRRSGRVRVTALWAEASAGLPLLPAHYWDVTFPPIGQPCGPIDDASGWHYVDSTVRCREVDGVDPDFPEVVTFTWRVPAGADPHSCVLAMVESADDPIDPAVRAIPERRIRELVVNQPQIALRNLHVLETGVPGDSIVVALLRYTNTERDTARLDLVFARSDAMTAMAARFPVGVDPVAAHGGVPPTMPLAADSLAVHFHGAQVFPSDALEAVFSGWRVPPLTTREVPIAFEVYGRRSMSHRVVVVARRGTEIMGGNTYLLRPTSP